MKRTGEVSGPPTPPQPRAVRLETARDCRKFLSRIINAAYRDELPHDKAGKLGYLVSIILKSIETHDIEKRVVALEERRGAR